LPKIFIMPAQKNLKRIFLLLRQYANFRGYEIENSEKEQLVKQFSRGRTTHLHELSLNEQENLIQYLLTLLNTMPAYRSWNRQMRLIFYYARQMGWLKGNEVDYERIDSWCTHYGYLHKPLRQHTAKELPKLVTQFERMYRDFLHKF